MAAPLPLVLGAPIPPLDQLLVPVLLTVVFAAPIAWAILREKVISDPLPATLLPTVEAAALHLGFRPCPPLEGAWESCRFKRDGVDLVASERSSVNGDGDTEHLRVKLFLGYGNQGTPTSLSGTRGRRPRPPSWATTQPTGDRAFDEAFAVHGSPPQAAGALDFETRALALSLQGRGMTTDRWGTLELTLVDPAWGSVRDAVTDLVTLAGTLALNGPGVPKALTRVASEDPVPGVRARALDLLHEHFPHEPSTQPTLLEALRSSEPEVAFAAAKAVGGPEGREVLLRLAGGTPGVAVRAEALAEISGLEDPRVEPTLIRALDARNSYGAPQAIALDAVRALASVGTVAAVGPLRQLLTWYYPFEPTAREVRRAIEQIHARAGVSMVGGLALAERAEVEGALAVPAAAGDLAIPGNSDSSKRA